MSSEGTSPDSSVGIDRSRRQFIAAAGAVGALGLAGCQGGSTGGEEAVTVASLNPMTGPFSSLGPGQRTGAELAVTEINNNDDYDFEFELVTGDTETEAGAAQSEAQRVVQEEGAEFVFGAISSSVALGLNDFAAQSEHIYFPGGAAVPITGSACNEWVFRFETNTAQIAEAISAYSVNNLGNNVWFHYADYAYGDSVYNRTSRRMESASDDYTEVGTSTSALGASNYGSFITQISNSDADVVVLGMTGGDLVNFTNQAADQGLTDQMAVVGPTQTFQSVRAGTGSNSVGTFGGARYDPSLETGDNQAFVEAYASENDREPGNFARVGYDSMRLMAKGMNEAGSTEPGDVRDALEGGTFTTVLGDITLRESDHQATNPTWMAELVEGDGDTADVELLEQVPGSETLPPASDLGCEM
ncbi:ABC transporter substrate-binding protein [Haloarcula hispanica]|uniref:Branched-chain amino acid ABC transporter substrate-binding protein n=1 Tax=Haloarcula hispanica TaxID=51589 RepID=A0A482TD91_HALHI|nr:MULTISPECIES: ABC transporter substrate-binding protein [Haloarcula]KAA9404862.1 branched-chain amino acid ABC transporter substrate-binding protein [Haloarcula hispanica]MCJ0618062.1 ABC transporter substrate-binding protein [Haloarcula hispanica]MUV48538.1 ABC transporter substrate-binding protein [Haloarcula sp. CBA1122]RYJ15580.1 branched-chain amino acid ABC transporter substrate-binding protein [Haloarcula hispanica]